jgi:hypothetical protein
MLLRVALAGSQQLAASSFFYAVFRCGMLAKNSCARSCISEGLRSSLCVAMPQV